MAPRDFEFILGRVYGAHREFEGGGRKQVRVFRSREETLGWLGIEEGLRPGA